MEELWTYLLMHPYLAFPLILIEGPIATAVTGSLITAGVISFQLAAVLAVTAELCADLVIFTAGRLGRHGSLRRHFGRFGLTDARLTNLQAAIGRNLPVVLAGAKVADATAVPVILAVGMSGVSYGRFIAWNVVMTLPKSLSLLGLGAVFGAQVTRLLNPTTAALLALTAICVYLVIRARVTSRQGAKS